MHASYAASTLRIDLLVPKLTGTDLLVQGWILTAALWVVVAGVALVAGRSLFGGPVKPPTPRRVIDPESGIHHDGGGEAFEVSGLKPEDERG